MLFEGGFGEADAVHSEVAIVGADVQGAGFQFGVDLGSLRELELEGHALRARFADGEVEGLVIQGEADVVLFVSLDEARGEGAAEGEDFIRDGDHGRGGAGVFPIGAAGDFGGGLVFFAEGDGDGIEHAGEDEADAFGGFDGGEPEGHEGDVAVEEGDDV